MSRGPGCTAGGVPPMGQATGARTPHATGEQPAQPQPCPAGVSSAQRDRRGSDPRGNRHTGGPSPASAGHPPLGTGCAESHPRPQVSRRPQTPLPRPWNCLRQYWKNEPDISRTREICLKLGEKNGFTPIFTARYCCATQLYADRGHFAAYHPCDRFPPCL